MENQMPLQVICLRTIFNYCHHLLQYTYTKWRNSKQVKKDSSKNLFFFKEKKRHERKMKKKKILPSAVPVEKENSKSHDNKEEQKKSIATAVTINGLRQLLVSSLHIHCSFDCLKSNKENSSQKHVNNRGNASLMKNWLYTSDLGNLRVWELRRHV